MHFVGLSVRMSLETKGLGGDHFTDRLLDGVPGFRKEVTGDEI